MPCTKTKKSTTPVYDSGSSSNQQPVTIPDRRKSKPRNQNRPTPQQPSETNSETTPLKGPIFSSNQQQMTMSCSRRKKQSVNQESLENVSECYDETNPLNGSTFSNNQQERTTHSSSRKKASLNQESLSREISPVNECSLFKFLSIYEICKSLQQRASRDIIFFELPTPLDESIFSSNQQQMAMSCNRRKKTSLNQESPESFSEWYDETTPLIGSIFSSNQQKVTTNLNQIFLKLFSYLSREILLLNESSLFNFLSVYETCKSCLNPHVRREIILFELPKLCFRRQLGNSNAITKVLLSIHQLPRTAVPHVVFFLAFNTVCNYILPRKSADGEKTERKRYVSFLAFFLEHCNAEKFTVDGKRVTEMMEAANPVLYARLLVFSDSNCVLALLQHGLRFNEPKDEPKMHPIFLYILARLSQFPPCMVHQHLNGRRSVPRKFVNLLANFMIILKSTYNPRAVIFHMAAITEREFNILVDPINSFLKFANQGEDIKSQSPPTLKHLCRHAIRQRLYENWNLPHGIRQLPVKPRLMSYLQLCAD